ncbi:hypothetical protein [Sphingomonas sp. LaA6.9]|uniref:hypothetical protein n=1 Tax=Sphingomonas sp. LaA6.9 TaxID=2919914 RepID=UPI001F503AA3|nr:hypothetical protein [Sphingomonas sp. LaA6.9]MCJ8157040.1 hypothetical protein [Sphingomonas sp. LaA6.9]
MRVYVFYALLLTCFGYAWLRGGGPERAAATIILTGTVLTTLTYQPFATRFQSVETSAFLIDLAVWLALLALALKAERFWPLWIAGLQGVAVVVHAVKILDPTILRWAYAFLMAIWVYPMMLILTIGIWGHQRRVMQYGADPSWTRSFGS